MILTDPVALIGEIVITVVSAVALVICIYGWMAFNEYAAGAYIVPTTYMALMFSYFLTFQPALMERVVWVQLGILLLLANVIVWRIHYILRQRSKIK